MRSKRTTPSESRAAIAAAAVSATPAIIDGGPRFMRIEAVMLETALPRSTLYKKVQSGEFPAPVRLTPRISAWEAVSVRAWVQARIDESAAARAITA